MNVLIIKMSSLGDIVHTLPAVTDAAAHGHRFDWVAEEAFTALPARHPAVNRVHSIAIRRWRHQLRATKAEREAFKAQLRQPDYDLVIDAQGLIKSAWVGRWLKGTPVVGLNRASIREALASFAYNRRYHVPKGQHAVDRVRSLFAQALGYDVPQSSVDFGLPAQRNDSHQLLGFHGTTWRSKAWPVGHWRELAERVGRAGFELLLPWGDEQEFEQANAIADGVTAATVLPAMSLTELLETLSGVAGVAGVDSGLTHAAAAFGLPTASVFGATNPQLTRPQGEYTRVLASERFCAPCMARECRYPEESPSPPCFADIDAARVWHSLEEQMRAHRDLSL
ncbi:MAG: lipopolysaccharide heptosyltransferase I [Pseudomonadaceae bacterium]|nr:lipopolysaccharide heptosyltransferase I [Pseudomonadaceae bacterium]